MPIGRIRKSGNSAVLVINPQLLQERRLGLGELVEYQIFKNVDLSKNFGKGRHLKIDAQKAKDMVRKEWSF